MRIFSALDLGRLGNAEKDARLIEALKKLTHAVNTLNTTSATAADLSALEARVAYVETYPTSGV